MIILVRGFEHIPISAVSQRVWIGPCDLTCQILKRCYSHRGRERITDSRLRLVAQVELQSIVAIV